MEREEAIDRLSVAFGECRDAIRRQAEVIEQLDEDMDKLIEAFGKVKALAKRLPRQNRKSYQSPYAKFDKNKEEKKMSEDKKFKPVEYEPIGCKNYPDIMDALGAQLTRKYERPYYDKRSETIKHIKV